MTVDGWIDVDGRLYAGQFAHESRQVESDGVVEPEYHAGGLGRVLLDYVFVSWTEADIDIRRVDVRGQRHIVIRIVVREIALADAAVNAVARDVQVINVLKQVRDKEEGVDVVLMLGWLCGRTEVILFIRARLEIRRVV